MRLIACLAPILLLASTAVARDSAPTFTPRQAKDLDKALAGKVAGKPVTCVRAESQGDLTPIGDRVMLYRVSRNLVYRNDVIGSCGDFSSGDTLVIELHGNQYCRGDFARSVDLRTGIRRGGCALGDFVPYRTPGK